jgi:hypothetical protein
LLQSDSPLSISGAFVFAFVPEDFLPISFLDTHFRRARRPGISRAENSGDFK